MELIQSEFLQELFFGTGRATTESLSETLSSALWRGKNNSYIYSNLIPFLIENKYQIKSPHKEVKFYSITIEHYITT